MTLGEKIKQLRKEHGLTQEELGEKIGVQKAAIQKYEKGTVKNIKTETLIKISKVLDTTPEYLLGWNMPKNVHPVENEATMQIPIIGKVAAGLNCFAEDNIIDYESVSISDICPSEQYAYLKVTGDSMYPMLMEDDLVLIKVQNTISSGSYGVVTIDNENGLIKKIVYGNGYIELQSINPMYPPLRFSGEDMLRVRIFGVLKEIKRKL